MKPIILLASSVMLLSTATSFAQKNTWIIDAGANANHQTIPSYSSGYPSLSLSGGGLNIAIGRQLSNHFAVGILGGYGSQQNLLGDYSGANTYKATFNTWNIGVYGRYTYWINKHLYLYSQISASHHDYNVKSTMLQYNYPGIYQSYFTSATQPDGLDITLLPAVGVNLIKGFGIHADVGGISYTRTPGGGSGNAVNGINLNIGQSFHFGLHKIIGWKKMNSTPNDPNAMLNK